MAARKQQVNKLAAESAFVFVGTVIKAKDATMANLAADNTAIVEIERVVSAPDMFKSVVGQRITARFRKASDVKKKGATLTFFANGWIFGQTLAVDVVGTAPVAEPPVAASMVRDTSVAAKDNVLRERLASAKMAVAGRVAEVSKSDQGPTYISEHDPNWHTATINVDEVVKGKKGTRQVSILFPQSDDVRWHRVPKYGVGQQGVWLLQPGRKQATAGIPPKLMAAVPAGRDVLTTLHPLDFLPLHELERVRALAHE